MKKLGIVLWLLLPLLALGQGPLSSQEMQAFELFGDGEKYFVLEEFPKALSSFEQAALLAPTNAAIQFKIAETRLQLGQLPAAEAAIGQALQLEKRNKYYYLLQASVLEKQNKWKEAAATYAALLKNIPEEKETLYALATAQLQAQQAKNALKTTSQIEKEYGLTEDLVRRRQQIMLKMNNLKGALKEGDRLIAAFPEETRFKLLQAQLYYTNNRLQEATKLLDAAIAQDKSLGQARLLKANLLRQQGKNAEAATEMLSAFEDPEVEIDQKVEALVSITKGLSSSLDSAEAMPLARALTVAHPSDAKAHALLGDILNVLDLKHQARASYLRATQQSNSTYTVWEQIVRLDVELNEVDSLARHTGAATLLFPNQAILWFYNGRALLVLKQEEQAVKSLSQAKRLAAGNTGMQLEINGMLGDAFHSLKKYDESDQAYEDALELDPNNDYILNNYSYYLSLRKQKLEKAKRMGKKLVEKHPADATYLDTYGWVLYVSGDYSSALTYLEKAAKGSSNATIVEHYGDVLFKLGKKEEALAQWKKAQNLGGEVTELLPRKIADQTLHE